MPIDLAKVQWDKPPAIDPSKIQWDDAPQGKQYGSAIPQLDETGAPIRQDAIPQERAPSPSLFNYGIGIPEAALALTSGMVGGVVAPYAGVASTLFGGKYGTQEGAREGEAVANKIQQAMTYQPSSLSGQQMTNAVGETLQGLSLESVPFSQAVTAGAMAPTALRQAGKIVGNEAGYLKNAIDQIPSVAYNRETTAAKNLSESYKNAAKIEAAQLGEKYNVILNPDVSNPTTSNKIRGAIVGDQNVSEIAAEKNKITFNNVAKKDVGIPETKTLNAETFKEAHAAPELTAPYEKARSIPKVDVYDNVLSEIDKVKTKNLIGDSAENSTKLNNYIDEVKAQIAAGGDGNLFVDSARKLRKDAQDIYANQHTPGGLNITDRNLADAKMGLANAIESSILDSLPLKDRNAFLKAREDHAKLYTLEQATNLATGQVDPKYFAKMIEEQKPISGAMRDLGFIVANNPDIASEAIKQKLTIPRMTRATLPALIGATLGNAIAPGIGFPIGLAAGASVGEVGKRILVKNMLKPEYQSRRAVPKDYRPQVNALRPVEPGQSNIVPFDPRNNPNFVMPENETTSFRNNPNRPDARQPMQETAPMQPAGSNALRLGFENDPQGSITIDRARQLNMERNAEAQGLTAEANARAPTGAGIQFDLDPITRRLQPTSRGLPGASIDVVEYANKNLTSAAQKLSRSQAFELTAAEKVAFDRTKIDLAIIDPKFKSLSDKEIAAKMFNRSSVEDLIQKAKDQAIGFEEIARRSNDQKLIFDANANRQRMLDLAEDLEANLTAPRAKEAASRKGQGPKTREAITNRLRGGDNVNNLRE